MALSLYRAYIPTFLYSISIQALFLLLPLYLIESGFSASLAAIIIGMRGLGLLITDIPSGYFSDRYGNYAGLVIGSALFVLAYALIVLPKNPQIMIFGGIVLGIGLSLSQIGRQGFIAFQMTNFSIGKKLSLLGSAVRFGALIGPPSAAFVADIMGYRASFNIMLATACFAFCVELYILHRSKISKNSRKEKNTISAKAFFAYVKSIRPYFVSSTTSIFILQALRTSKIALIPLMGSASGYSISAVGIAVAAGTFADSLVSVKAGTLMDRKGRRWSALPSTLGLSVGFILLGFSNNFWGFLVAVFILGAFDGISAGLVLVLAADLAPKDKGQSQYLALIKLISDSAMAIPPLLIAYLLLFSELSVLTIISGVIGLIGFAGLLILMHETRDFNKVSL